MTGWGRKKIENDLLTHVFDHHKTKPIDPVALDRLLAKAVSHLRNQRDIMCLEHQFIKQKSGEPFGAPLLTF